MEYRYSYGVAATPPCTFANGLGKFDMVAGKAKLWHEPGCIPGEPVMVPRPGAQVLPAPLPAMLPCSASSCCVCTARAARNAPGVAFRLEHRNIAIMLE